MVDRKFTATFSREASTLDQPKKGLEADTGRCRVDSSRVSKDGRTTTLWKGPWNVFLPNYLFAFLEITSLHDWHVYKQVYACQNDDI